VLSPAVVLIILLSVFPLIISAYLAFSRFQFVAGGFEVTWIGLTNFRKLLTGSQSRRFLGASATMPLWGWALLLAFVAGMAYGWWQTMRESAGRISSAGRFRISAARLITTIIGAALLALMIRTLQPGGIPGTVVVTIIFVVVGVFVQYLIGLGLAVAASQRLRGKRFFRAVFLIPMTITPVGAAYVFKMIADTGKGPLEPIWSFFFGAGEFTWVQSPWGARIAILVADTWQWTPFMFIILVAAVEGVPDSLLEAAKVDGAGAFERFRRITFPLILPVTLTLVLIRFIEAFKIIDLPQVLTGGGPGTATESMALQAVLEWRGLNLGGSAAISYALLVLTTFFALVLVNFGRRRALAQIG
jgi:multiple sugar transport system permease protein